MILSKKETVFQKKLSSNKEFSNFQEKYEYYSSNLMVDVNDLIEQFNIGLVINDTLEERTNVIKKMKEDRETFKLQVSELKNEILGQLEKYHKTKAKMKSGKITEKQIESSPFSQQVFN